MFVYTSIFIASVIAALIFLYVYNALKSVGKAAYRAIGPSAKDNISYHINERPKHATNNGKRAPWGWKGNDRKAREHGPKSAVRKASSGFDAFINNVGNEGEKKASKQSAAGWPDREEKSEFAGKAYKVKRKATPRKPNLKTTSTPWGW